MSKIIKIKAYEFQELNNKAKQKFIYEMYDTPFDYEDEDENGNTIIKYDYFADMDLEDQIEFCEMNNYLFDVYGNVIRHLEVMENVNWSHWKEHI